MLRPGGWASAVLGKRLRTDGWRVGHSLCSAALGAVPPQLDRMNVFHKQYLMTAGPTPLPPAVSQVMAEPILYHRAPAFIEVYARSLERLKRVFQTDNDVL